MARFVLLAATWETISIALGPLSASFLDRVRGYARSVKANAAALSPRLILVRARI
jgi:hypothetical protein